MKVIKLSILLGIAVLLAGCSDSLPVSLHPLFMEKDVIYNPALVGKWVDKEDGNKLIFQKAEDSGYLMTIEGKDSPPEKFRAQLIRLGEFLFLDLCPEAPATGDDTTAPLLWIPGHSFSKVKITKDTLQLDILDEDWLEKKMLAKEVTLAHEYVDERIVLTAPTTELQAFVKKYGTDEEAFLGPLEWQRKKK
jgi:hypothetical protein